MAKRGFPITQQMRAERRKQAEARQAEYDKLTLQQKLDKLPPEPQAMRQRNKLLALMNKVTQEKELVEVAERVLEKVKKNKKGMNQ